MLLPPLYKYLDVEGAKLTLRNRNFRHAKPSDFNDIRDMAIESLFPEDEEAALTSIVNNFTSVLLRNLDNPPTCINLQTRDSVTLLQAMLKNTPVSKLATYISHERSISDYYDLNHMRYARLYQGNKHSCKL